MEPEVDPSAAPGPRSGGAEFHRSRQHVDRSVATPGLSVQTGGSHDTYRGPVDQSRNKTQFGDNTHFGDKSKLNCFDLLVHKNTVYVTGIKLII